MKSTENAENSALIAVITGDLVGSSKLSGEIFSQVILNLERLLKSFRARYDAAFDIFRGDSFQLVVAPPLAARLATLIDLSLRSGEPAVAVRQCIGIGKGDAPGQNVKTATGEAYALSGHGLDKLKGRGLTIASADKAFTEHCELLTRFFDSHLDRLTSTQAQVVLAYLMADNKSHEHLARVLDKKRSNVTRILNTSQYHLITDYLAHFAAQVKKDFAP